MSDFFKKFLTEDPRRLSPSGCFVGLAAFGKHPGWDDHVEDLGLETESLILAKQVLYVNGIGGQIDAGAWEKLDAGRQLPAFKHLFVWQRGGQFLIGRMWSSSDGKGRKSYPLVVCVHCAGVPLGVALKQVLPALAELQVNCQDASTAEEIRALLNRTRASLRESLTTTEPRADAPLLPEQLSKILKGPAAAGNPEAFLRVLYQLQSQMSSFAPGKFNSKTATTSLRPQQLRVGTAGVTPEQEFLFWTRFLQTQIDATLPLLLALPIEESWLDVLVGEPDSAQFFCLRASPKAVSLVSEVPYTLDDTFRAKASEFLSAFARGETSSPDLRVVDEKPVAATEPTTKKSGWLRWLGVGALGIVAVIAAVFFLRPPPPPKAEAPPPVAKPSALPPAATNAAVPPAPVDPVKTRLAAEADAARVAAEQKNSETMAAAAKLKEEAQAAATKEKERQIAEDKRLAAEKEAQQRVELARAEAARKKAEEEQRIKAQQAAAAVAAAAKAAPADLPASAEMTNSIGMILVLLPSKIWVGKYEVTQAEYQQVMGANPSKSQGPRHPVSSVTWNDAKEFCRKLTEQESGKLPAETIYALPTEKQWQEFPGGEAVAAGASRTVPAAVGTAGPANKFGLFDVLGNVWEWTNDGATGEEKLLKGGTSNSDHSRTLLPDKSASNCGFRCILTKP